MSSPAPRRFEPGSAFMPERGKLYLFERDSALVVRPWPDPRAWRLGATGPWTGARPIGLDLAAPDRRRRHRRPLHRRRQAAQAAAFALIPDDQRRLAASFGDRAWPLHCLFTRVPGAMELARLCPALAAGLAFHASLRPRVARPYRSARALLGKPPPRIARAVGRWLGFGRDRATVRVLRRLPPALCSPGNLRLLQRALAMPAVAKALTHLPTMNAAVLTTLHHLLDPAGPVQRAGPLLQLMARLPQRSATVARSQLAGAVASWAEAWPGRPMPELRSFRQLHRLRNQADAELASPARLLAWAEPLGPFAAPMADPTNAQGLWLRPLTDVQSLIDEAGVMGHCLASRLYVEHCAQGLGSAYAVRGALRPDQPGRERATVWLGPGRDGRAELGQLLGPGNHPVSDTLSATVRTWLHHHNHPDLAPRLRGDDADLARTKGRTLRVVRHRHGRSADGARAPTPTHQAPQSPPCQLQLGFIPPF